MASRRIYYKYYKGRGPGRGRAPDSLGREAGGFFWGGLLVAFFRSSVRRRFGMVFSSILDVFSRPTCVPKSKFRMGFGTRVWQFRFESLSC